MVHRQLFDIGNYLQMWRSAANILNKQMRTANKGWFIGLLTGLTTPS
jgi:hypothetical protein